MVATPGLFRVLLAFVVFASHCTPLHLGSGAVYLFFMLSGFWIYDMWGREYAPTRAPYRVFVTSRLWRLLPVHYVALLLYVPLQFWIWNGFPVTTGWTALHFYFSHLLLLGYATLPLAIQLNGVAWSLDIELQFYLVAPLLIALLVRYPLRSVPRLGLYALALAGLAVFLVVYGPHGPNTASLPMYLIFFLIGLQTAQHRWKPAAAPSVALLAASVLLIGLCICLPSTRPILIYREAFGPLSGANTVVNVLLALLMAAYAMATVNNRPQRGTRTAAIDRTWETSPTKSISSTRSRSQLRTTFFRARAASRVSRLSSWR